MVESGFRKNSADGLHLILFGALRIILNAINLQFENSTRHLRLA